MVQDTKQNSVYHFIISFSKVKNPPKLLRKITGRRLMRLQKENHCTARWHMNGFLSHEMFNWIYIWSKNAFHAKMLNWFSLQFKIAKFGILILMRKINGLACPPCYSLLHPLFPLRHRFSPPDLVFSTARVYQIPGPRNPGPVFSSVCCF